MTLAPEQLHILQHSLGCDKYGHGTHDRNRYVCDPNPDMVALCEAGLMRDHGVILAYGGMHLYEVTEAGKAAMREKSPVSPKRRKCVGPCGGETGYDQPGWNG